MTGRIGVSAAGLAGDGQADPVVHGGAGRAVHAYPAEHLGFWRAALGPDELAPGWFGENLTLAGLTEDTVHLGERIRVGSALLEVREPRTPCFKLGIRLGREDAVTRFLRAGRPGYYLSVVEPGGGVGGRARRTAAAPGARRGRVADGRRGVPPVRQSHRRRRAGVARRGRQPRPVA